MANTIDPSRTTTLRRLFVSTIQARMRKLKGWILKLLVVEDVFGLKPSNRVENEYEELDSDSRLLLISTVGNSFDGPRVSTTPTLDRTTQAITNTRWRFNTNEEQKRLFEEWIATQIGETVLADDAYWEKYIQDSYMKGQGRAWDDFNRGKKASGANLDFMSGSRQEFLNGAFNHPPSIERVKLLASRTFTDLKGVTDTISTDMSRILVDGLIQGEHPNRLASRMNQRIDGITRTRARTIARTETIRAHAEGQLDSFERMGVTELGVMVEWDTTGDDRVCQLCAPLEGIVVKIKESRGMLPRHPNCRCAWTPANLGESPAGQKRGKQAEKAIDESIKEEIPKKQPRTLEEQKAKSPWPGAEKKIQQPPKSIISSSPKSSTPPTSPVPSPQTPRVNKQLESEKSKRIESERKVKQLVTEKTKIEKIATTSKRREQEAIIRQKKAEEELRRIKEAEKTKKAKEEAEQKLKDQEALAKKRKAQENFDKNQEKWEDSLTESQDDAITDYTSSNKHREIRRADNYDPKSRPETFDPSLPEYDPRSKEAHDRARANHKKHKKTVKHLNKSVDDAPNPTGEVYRGMHVDAKTRAKYTEGAEVEFETLQSWSREKEVADKFSKGDDGILLKVELDGSTNAADLTNVGGTGESEILVGKGAKMRVKEVRGNEVILEVVEDAG